MVKETINTLNKKIEELKIENDELKNKNKSLLEENEVLKKNKKVNKEKVKNSDEPKKGRTAYRLFLNEEIDKHKKENPDKKIILKTINKELGLSEKWEKIKKDEKKYEIYIKMKEDDEKRYEHELELQKKQ